MSEGKKFTVSMLIIQQIQTHAIRGKRSDKSVRQKSRNVSCVVWMAEGCSFPKSKPAQAKHIKTGIHLNQHTQFILNRSYTQHRNMRRQKKRPDSQCHPSVIKQLRINLRNLQNPREAKGKTTENHKIQHHAIC